MRLSHAWHATATRPPGRPGDLPSSGAAGRPPRGATPPGAAPPGLLPPPRAPPRAVGGPGAAGPGPRARFWAGVAAAHAGGGRATDGGDAGGEAAARLARLAASPGWCALIPAATRDAYVALEALKLAKLNALPVAEIADWVAGKTGVAYSGEFGAWLKDGVVLCGLANALAPGAVPKVNAGSAMMFKQMENIANFLRWAKTSGGPGTFENNDLYEGKDLAGGSRSV
jgi:hypothetical protein